MKATSLPCPPTWPILSIFRTLGFFLSIVLHEAGVRISWPPAVTMLDSREPFHKRMGSPGSQRRGVEPLATVLTAGGTKQSTPHHCCMAHCGHQEVQTKMLTLLCIKMAGIRWECNIQDPNCTSVRSPVQFPRCCFGELLDEIGNCKYMMTLKRISRVCP